MFSVSTFTKRLTGFAILVFAGFGGSLELARAQQSLVNHNYDTGGGTKIGVSTVFGSGASRGFIPVRVTLRNGGIQDRNWTLDFNFDGSWNQMNYRSSFRVSAPAGTESTHDLMVPVPTSVQSGSMYRSLTLEATSPGLKAVRNSDSTNYSVGWPAIAWSEKLANRNANTLDKAIQAHGSSGRGEKFGDQFDPEMLPADWRGYTSLDVLMMTDEEWQKVAPSSRLAIVEWIRLGGRLHIYTTGKADAAMQALDLPGVPNPSGTEKWLSLGEVRTWNWNGQDLKENAMIQQYKDIENRTVHLSEDYKTGWNLYQNFGSKSFNPWVVILILIAFGIIVGPVNLFIWAKPGQRHRMFFTTPIIALGASGLILLLILFNDGIGGKGRRFVLANLQSEPREKRLYIHQEQISRTGVLLGSGFPIQDPVFLSPVMIPSSQWNRIDLSGGTIANYSLNNRTYRGDWFQSRSEQGHFIQSVRPTRSRIELTEASADPDIPPKLFSSLEFTVDEFFYRDDQGQVWKGQEGQIAGGEEIVVSKVDPEELLAWWKSNSEELSDKLGIRAKNLIERPGHFFAVSDDQSTGFIGTLGSINWKQDKALIYGTVSAAGASPPPGSSEGDKEDVPGQ